MAYEYKKPRSIIAMKGPPFTGKTSTASIIAAYLNCPVLSLDDFLEDLQPHYFQTPFPSSSSIPRDLAFKIICRIAYTHLDKGIVDNIVIDSPLSTQDHLDQLTRLASIRLAPKAPKTRLVIVECKPNNQYMWQDKFEKYADAYSQPWYKPKDWDDVVKAVQDKYDERSDDYKVSKLVCDPFSSFNSHLCDLINYKRWKQQPIVWPAFMEALNYMITRDESEGPDVVVFSEWQQSKYLPLTNENRQSSMRQGFCSDGHHTITNYTEKVVPENEDVSCTVCEQQVTGAAYTCTACSLALHKECVEPSSNLQPPCITVDMVVTACASCMKDGKTTTKEDCLSCVFQFELRRCAYERVASVIRHECEEHFLVFTLLPPFVTSHCMACGVTMAVYMYSCKICGATYDYKCLTEVARQVKHVHGGHRHHMLLKFSDEEVEEDYLCNECLEKRDPKLWFYSCQECPFNVHLHCARDGIE